MLPRAREVRHIGDPAELLGALIAAARDDVRSWLLRDDAAAAERREAAEQRRGRDDRDAPR